ncbi:MAG: 5-formyltetrahydrofolate cyclo-ligase, partial [Rhodospirillales bacterium]
MADDDIPRRGFASPPCFMHEIDPDYTGLPPGVDDRQATDVKRWRKAERLRLLNERQKLAPKVRQTLTRQLQDNLTEFLGSLGPVCISGYWPIRGEPDLRGVLKDVIAAGGRAALPVVAERNRPLQFRAWSPGDRLERGIWDIPTPPAEAEMVRPDVLLAPFLGF